MNSAPECYASKENGKLPECKTCKYQESCALMFETEPKMERKSGLVSYEACNFSEEVADSENQFETFAEPPQHEKDENELRYSDEDLLRLMTFMLRIDDYALGVVESVINNSILTASEAARVFNVSRQAMHRKILDSVRKNSELRVLFRANLHRCKKLRNEHLNHGGNRQQDKEENIEQMEMELV